MSTLSLFLVASLFASPALQDVPQRVPDAVAVVHDGQQRVVDALHRAGGLRHDAGEFLVAELTPATRAWLGRQGAEIVSLPALDEGEVLFLWSAVDVDALSTAGARLLFQLGSQALIAAPPERAVTLRRAAHFHGGLARVSPRPMVAPRRPVPTTMMLGSADPRVQTVVDAVDISNAEATVLDLSSIPTRCASGPGAIVARDRIVLALQGYGYTPVLQSFSGQYSENVIAELPGTVTPDEIVVLGAHYDSIAGSCSSTSPGADDNATGTAGVIEAARVLASGGPYERTVRFILFSAEEAGLVGSEYAAAQSAAAGEDIIAMLNSDMSAYRAPGDARDVDFVTNNSTPALRDFCAQIGALYVPNWASTSGSLSAGTSDHKSYFSHGFPAVFYFEDVGQYSPYIHSSADAHPQSSNDFELSEMIVKGFVAAAATLAEPVDMQVVHTPLPDSQNLGPYPVGCQVISLSGAIVTDVELQYAVDGGAWTSVAMTPQGGDWVAQIPGAGSPVTIEYWIRAFDDQGGSESLPDGADLGAPPFSFFVGVLTVLHFDDFEGGGDAGWTHGQVATQDDWQHGPVFGKEGDPGAAWSGQRVWGNDLGPDGWNGAYAADVNNWLRSPAFDLSSAPNVHLRYRRWLTVEDGIYDQAQIRLDGTVVWQNTTGTGGDDQNHTLDSAWTLHSLDISAQAAGDAAVQIEYRLISDGGLQFGGWNLDDFSLVRMDPVECPPTVTYCTTSPNSVGPGALIDSNGETSIAANAFELSITGAAPLQVGLFIYGAQQVALPLGDGTRCVGGTVFRLMPMFIDGAGNAGQTLDFDHLPSGGDITTGSVWNFQFWYRDPAAGGAGSNLSDALNATFCP